MTEISAVMRAYRDALDRHRIPWADDTYDTERVGGYMQYEPISTEPFMATPGDILADIFGVRGESR